MKEYDIFIPLYDNDGEPVPSRTLRRLQSRLLEEFGGLTYFHQPSEGYWKMGDITYRDEITIYRVLSSKVRRSRRFLSQLKVELKSQLRQEEILIVEREVKTL